MSAMSKAATAAATLLDRIFFAAHFRFRYSQRHFRFHRCVCSVVAVVCGFRRQYRRFSLARRGTLRASRRRSVASLCHVTHVPTTASAARTLSVDVAAVVSGVAAVVAFIAMTVLSIVPRSHLPTTARAGSILSAAVVAVVAGVVAFTVFPVVVLVDFSVVAADFVFALKNVFLDFTPVVAVAAASRVVAFAIFVAVVANRSRWVTLLPLPLPFP